ncbi:NACHT, LRR and PYD domains-containing protein [Acrasis kona]|uniref:NACHT, LRR and PYD domains-containing protein n=1 Tax=Acrasis kona TaxID=1008807 RepID=A0AAW2YLA1_9EUKA
MTTDPPKWLVRQRLMRKEPNSQFTNIDPDSILLIMSFIDFPLNLHMKRIFSKDSYTSVDETITVEAHLQYQQRQYYSRAKANHPRKSIPLFMLDTPLVAQQNEVFKLLYGRIRGRIYQLWSSINLSCKSCYQLDQVSLTLTHSDLLMQEQHLTVDQLKMLISSFSNLRSVNFCGFVNFNDVCIKWLIIRNPSLQSLDLRVTSIDFEGVQTILKPHLGKFHLKTLKLTRLSRAPFTESNIITLRSCPSLTHLSLTNNGLHAQEIKTLVTTNPPITDGYVLLNLSCNSISDDGARALCLIKSLKSLYLEDCGLTNDGVESILKELRLTNLDLSRNRAVNDEGIKSIVDHETLEYLKLSDITIKDKAAWYLSQNKLLKELDLDYTKITFDGLDMILFGEYKDFASGESVTPKMNIMNTLVSLNIRSAREIIPIPPPQDPKQPPVVDPKTIQLNEVRLKLKNLQESGHYPQFKNLIS